MLDKFKNIAAKAAEDLKKNLANLPARYTLTYDAGLPDVKGPKSMALFFNNDKLTITYPGTLMLPKTITILPNDIIELDLGVQNVDQTANAMKGAIAGNLLGGSLGAIGLASLSSNRRKEDHLHLIINYNGQERTIFFQTDSNFQKVFAKLQSLANLKSTPLRNKQTTESTKDNSTTSTNIDYAKQLTDLHGLLEKGIINQSEFDLKKADILSKM